MEKVSPISIVGAGPGAIDLLTIRALDRIKNADVLIWTDSLISPDIADLTTKNCQKFRTSSLTLEQILELLITKAKQGLKEFDYTMEIHAYMVRYQSKYAVLPTRGWKSK